MDPAQRIVKQEKNNGGLSHKNEPDKVGISSKFSCKVHIKRFSHEARRQRSQHSVFIYFEGYEGLERHDLRRLDPKMWVKGKFIPVVSDKHTVISSRQLDFQPLFFQNSALEP